MFTSADGHDTSRDARRGFTSAEFVQAVRDTVAEYGADYVYETPTPHAACVYRSDGKPSCLFGHALDRLGVTQGADDLSLNDIGTINEVLVRLGYGYPPVRHAALVAQGLQDSGMKWGEVLEEFEAALIEHGYNESATRTM